jgi:uncharacterized repeat protein (TIGR03803 family)
LLFIPGPVDAAQQQVLQGHVPVAVARLQPIARLPATNRLDLALGLPLRNREALANLLDQLYDRASPNYHHYLTPEEFAARCGPTEQDYRAVIAFANAHGLTVTGTHPNRTLLDVNGSVAQLERALHLNLRVYRHPTENRTFHAPDAEPSLDLAVPILAISGLDDFVLPRPMDLRRRQKSAASRRAEDRRALPLATDSGPEATAWTTGSGPRGTFIGRDFRDAYAPGVSLTGAGQIVGLFELDGYFPSDITSYESLAGLPNVPLTNVLLNGFSGSPGVNNDEVALDIEMAISMAPGLAAVLVYEGTVANDVLNRMATDNLAKQLSCSWGFGSQLDPVRGQIYQQFAAQGQSMFQASGDSGAYAGAVHPPSDDPLLTVVGGTSLTTTNPGGAWVSETTWSGSGGGVSTVYALPTWQQGVSMATNQGSTAKRNIPDVACVADQTLWVVVNNGEQGATGGTSAATPLWAAFTALANQQAAAAGQPSVGFLNPALYAIGKGPGYAVAFHDITTGSNVNGSSPTKFLAVPGYDLCTGWGTPTGSNLIAALLAPPVAPLITPGAPLAFSGPPGGPFTPATQIYTLTNTTLPALTWSLANASSWFSLSPTAGTLTPGGPATIVTATLTPAATNLPAGSDTATIWFTNLNDQSVQSRQLTLAVFAPPVITTQPVNQAVFEGMTASFSVVTASNALLSYRWQQDNGIFVTNLTDGGNISGSAASTLTVSNVFQANVGAYSVVVSNAAGMVTSSNAFLTIVPWRPVITTQPASQAVLPGQTVTMTVGAVGTQPLFYQWQANGTNLSDGAKLTGSRTSTLTLNNVSATNAGTYTVLVGNGHGLVPSSPAVLTVLGVTAPGTTLVTLYPFTGGNDGGNPNALLQAANGLFYGTTQNGGTNSAGTVFQMAPNGAPVSLYSFTGGSDGATPYAGLASGPDGSFYGTAFEGGAYDNGTVFRINSNGVLATLVAFNITNGDLPYAGLSLGADGNFYGTTYQGAPVGNTRAGTVFRMATNGALSTLTSFTGDMPGVLPNGGFLAAGVVQGGDGNLYGTTYKGGAYGYGTVFRVGTNGLFSSLACFNSANGAFPYGGLVQGIDGNYYGTTTSGGASGSGAVFRITPAGLLTNLYSFTGGNDGNRPVAGLLLGNDGNFYGTTFYGGTYGQGTIFRIAPNGALTTLAHFDGFNGANPQATMTQGSDGNLYGTTQNGGADGQGVLFRLSFVDPPQITTQPQDQSVFAGANVLFSVAAFGSFPLSYQWQVNGTNLADGSTVFGSATRNLTLNNVSLTNIGTYSVLVTNSLGSVTSTGAVLQVTSSPPVIVLQPTNQTLVPGATAIFAAAAIGNLPLSYQWQQNGTNLTDSTNRFGSATSTLTLTRVVEPNSGTYTVIVSNALTQVTSTGALLTVISVTAPGTRLTTLHGFTGTSDGGIPNGLVQGTNGVLYGTTQSGGVISAGGTVFALSTSGVLTTLISFRGTNGSKPEAALVQAADGNFYGTTFFGGLIGEGTVFRMTPDGSLATLYSFTGDSDGSGPTAALVQGTDGNLYSTMGNGGQGGSGYVLRISLGGALTNLYSFTNGVDGASPAAGLVQATDGNFYGMTPVGAQSFGNIFQVTPGGALANLYSFTGGTDGYAPAGSLVQATDGILYGTTTHSTFRGFQFYGTIFKVTTNGVLNTVYTLNFTDGAYPYAGLVQAGDGNFYGTTHDGGTSGNGTVFKVTPNGALSTLASFDGFDSGAHPASALVLGTDASLYGTTTTGGPGGRGTVFRLSFSPQITFASTNLTVDAGANLVLSPTIFGTLPLFYQWLQNGTNLVDAGNLSGSTTAALTITNVTPSNAGTYSLFVSNTLGSATASELLKVAFPPVFQSAGQTNGIFKLGWSTGPGLKYQLQYKPLLNAANWTNLGTFITATGATAAASDVIGSNAQRFYRVVLLP